MKILCNKLNPSLGGLLAAELYRSVAKDVEIVWSEESSITLQNSAKPVPYGTSNDLIRILENAFNKSVSPLQRVTMNHWLSFSLILEQEIPKSLDYLDKILGPLTYLVGESLSVSDLAVFSVLYVSEKFKEIVNSRPSNNNILRWMKLVQAQEPVSKVLEELPRDVLANLSKASPRKSPPVAKDVVSGRLQEGKFVDLPHAEMGKVVVRFPPEASGFLHIGHAKAALLNQYYQQAFEGKLIMRFDDTNPAKENAEFEKVILDDVKMLEIKPDLFTHTSQYFDLMLEYCEKLIKEGKAFVDDTPPEQMKNEREQKIESKNRNNTVVKNLQLWEEMQKGSSTGVQNCVRAKIDMQSTNGCMRDPTIYRCKPEPHPRTGTNYKVYPTYDFACPIVDAIEGVTHVLRTMEYHDRDPQFYWFIDALALRKPYIWEYSRLSMTNTVLSKRKLTWFVEQGLVDGWDDPRMPTVRGVLRRGMTVEGLRQFIQAQGSSRSVVFMEWDKIWAINKKVIDPIAPRYTALETDPVPVKLKGVQSDTSLTVPLHPKNPNVGTKTIWVSKRLFIDQLDAKALKEGENATFINYGNVMIDKIHRDPDDTVTSIDATPNLMNKDFKKTPKLTWLADSTKSPTVETYCVYFDHIISKPLLAKDEDFKKYIGHQTRWEVPMMGEPELNKLKVGDIIELQRRGFFRVDVAPAPASPHTSRSTPLVLFHVPDGRAKEKPKPVQTSQANETVATSTVASGTVNLSDEIAKQGDLVRALKSAKSEKAKIDLAVKALLELKAKYKAETGQDWKPAVVPTASSSSTNASSAVDASTLNAEITKQGDLVRSLKAAKADKPKVEEAVKALLDLKAKYKAATGQDWKPEAVPTAASSSTNASSATDASTLSAEITKQGDLVRSLKAAKADKAKLEEAVKVLLDLKAKYKAATGQDWKPTAIPTSASSSTNGSSTIDASALNAEIIKQGDIVRSLKAAKLDKAKIDEAVKALLDLKAKYKAATGKDWKPPAAAGASSSTPDSTPALDLLVLNVKIINQGDLVCSLKDNNADKATLDEAIKELLDLKAKYKAASGQDWKPGTVPSTSSLFKNAASSTAYDVIVALIKQEQLVRTLKATKASKAKIDEAVKILLDLKVKYKAATGMHWNPDAYPTADPSKCSAKGFETGMLDAEIIKQTELVRSLKTTTVDKVVIDEAVQVLRDLKAKYKALSGKDWEPPSRWMEPFAIDHIIKRGNVVRALQQSEHDNSKLDEAVKALAELKASYRAATQQAWSAGIQTLRSYSTFPYKDEIFDQMQSMKDQREVNADKVTTVNQAINNLLIHDLQNKQKEFVGQDSKSGGSSEKAPNMSDDARVAELLTQITAQGDKVRKLKSEKAEKGVIDVEVTNLLNLKAQYKGLTGNDWTPKAASSQDSKKKSDKNTAEATTSQSSTSSTEVKQQQKAKKADKAPKPPKPVKEESTSGVKKVTRLGLEASKETDLSEWYSQVITKSEMIDYYDISGCYILRPWSYSIWDVIRNFLSTHFRKLGVKDGYFPIFVSKAALEREKDHIADFAPEVAWVTHSGSSELAEHIAIRPTSETAMYPAYAKWIQSHRDLPYKLNQWNNVVRWEFKQPQPFLRTREFLWQEGHTAFRTQEEAAEEVLQILELYARVYEELLAIPVIKGRKTEKEKFAGGDYTTTVEAYVPASGRGIQGATSHHLGQNFSKMFEIVYDDPDTQEKNYVYQNSWGLTTRTIGVMVLVHGDDRGLVLPPRVAEIQAIVVPCGITVSSTADERKSLIDSCKALVEELTGAGIRAEGDYRDNYSPGWKFNHWELKGVPIRVELGPKDMARGEVVAVQRLNGDKMTLKRTEAPGKLLAQMDQIHDEMLAKATKERNAKVSLVTKWEDFINNLERKHMLLAPFCGLTPCEDNIKNDSARTDDDPTSEVKGPAMGAKSLCIPFSPPRPVSINDRCIHPACNNKPKFITLFGRSY